MTQDKNSPRTDAREVTDEQTDTTEAPSQEQRQHDVDAAVTRMLATMSSRQRRKQLRTYRKQARREKWRLYRENWVDQQVDRPLTDTVESKLPSWTHTNGGRLAIIGMGLIVVLLWTLLVVLLLV